jgi:hypothetical protein
MVMVCKRLVCLVRIERIDGSRVSFVAGAPATTYPEVGGEVAGERGREKMVVVLCLFIKIRSRSKAT